MSGEYGLTNEKEFLAELAEVGFREKLKQVNLWQKVVDAFKKFFGISPNNALDAAGAALEYLLDNFDNTAWESYTNFVKTLSSKEIQVITAEEDARRQPLRERAKEWEQAYPQSEDIAFSISTPLTKAQKKRQIKNLGGLWIEDTQEYAKFVSAVNTYGVERDGEGITYTDNHFYAYYISIDGEPIPYVDIYLNAAQSQALINEITNDYKGTIRERIEQRLNHRDARARITENQNNVSDGNVNSLQSQRDDDGLGLHILRKGRYFDSPNLYVKGRRIDSAIYNEGILAKTTEQDSNDQIKDIVRLFGAISIDGKIYRVKTTVKRYIDDNVRTKAYSYEVTEIELLEGTHDDGISPRPRTSNNSISVVNLLQGIETTNQLQENISIDSFTTAAEAIAQQLGVEIEIDESMPAKGSYNPRTGRIRINPSRHATAEDVQRTVLHETIGHGGIQAVAGKRLGQVCQQVYDMMTEEPLSLLCQKHQ